MTSRRLVLLTMAASYALAAPGVAFAFSSNGDNAPQQETAFRRFDDGDAAVVLGDNDEGDDEATDATTDDEPTEFGGTVTRNRDGDETRGNDGTNGAATVTSNKDGDDTRGDDGTGDGDLTVGEDGTSDGDDTTAGE